jgi:hypothetical protein
VIRLTIADQLAGPRIATVLEGWALQNATGVLEIDGSPGGAIYLDQGWVTFARASWIPDLAARLRAALPPAVRSRNVLLGADQPDRDLGTMLTGRRWLSREQLAAVLTEVVTDAMVVLTCPLAESASVDAVRFEAGRKHWAGDFSRISVSSVRADALRIAGRLERHELAHTSRLELRELDAASARSAVLSREQWALACRIDGTSSAQDLAWQCGLPLYDVIGRAGELIEAGLCTAFSVAGRAAAETSAPPARRRRPSVPDPAVSEPGPGTAPGLVPAQRRAPGARPAPRRPGGPAAGSGAGQPARSAGTRTGPKSGPAATPGQGSGGPAGAPPSAGAPAAAAVPGRAKPGAKGSARASAADPAAAAEAAPVRSGPGSGGPRGSGSARGRPGRAGSAGAGTADPGAGALPQRRSGPRQAPPATPVPQPAAAQALPGRPAPPDDEADRPGRFTPLGAEPLRRVLEGLRRLS